MAEQRRGAGGRPRAFDEGQALDAAVEVFWRLGYEGASMAELTQAMGINKPSLYAVFGGKEELFVHALQRYRDSYYQTLNVLLDKPTGYEILESYLRYTASAVRAGSVLGCLSIQGGLSCAPANRRIPQLLAEYRQWIEDSLATALTRRGGGEAAGLAAFAVTIGQGLAVEAAAGVSQERLDAAVDVALAGLSRLLDPQAH